MDLSKWAHIFSPSHRLILGSSHFCWYGLISLCYCFSLNFWSQCTCKFRFPVVRNLCMAKKMPGKYLRWVCLTRPQSRFWNPAFGDQKSALWKETQRVAQSYNINNSILYQHHHLNGQVVSTEVQLLLSSTKARLAHDGLWQGVKGVVIPRIFLKAKS